jgi:hypothetical protein
MRKRWLTLTVTLMLLPFLASFSAVSAEPNGPIECLHDIAYAAHPECPGGTLCWYGPVHDCTLESLEGHIRFVAVRLDEWKTVGNTLHFFEEFTIYTDAGEIYGENAGIADQKKLKYRANGWVTGTNAAEWEHLVGSKFFEMGTVFVPADPPPIFYAPDTLMRIVPAQRPMP